MKSNKKFSILKLDGFSSLKHLTCTVSQNSSQIKQFPVSCLAENQELEYSPTHLIEIRIQSQSSTISGINFCPLLLKSDTWLPLYPGPKFPTLYTISEELAGPRIQLRGSKLAPEENNESYEIQAEGFESFTSELVLASLIESPSIDSEELLGKTDLQTKCKKQSMIIKVLTKQLEVNNDKNLQLSKKVEMLESKLSKTCEQLSMCLDNSNEREKALISTISQKDKEYQSGLNQNLALQAKIRTIENESEHLNDQIHRLELELERLKDAEKELLQSNKKLQKSESIQDQLNKTILKLSRSISDDPEGLISSQLSMKDAEIQMLKNVSEEVKKSADMQIQSLSQEITELRTVISKSLEQERVLANKLIHGEEKTDSFFSDYMQRLKLSYKKLSDFTYEVQGKAVNVALCRAGVFAKVGSSLLPLEEFFEDLLDRSPRDFGILTERINRSSEKKVQRMSSYKTFLKGTQSSLNKSKNSSTRTPSKTRVKSIERKPFR